MIKEDPMLHEFLEVKNVRYTTKKNYISRINKYSEFLDMTPSDVIAEAEEDEENMVRLLKRRIKKISSIFL